MWDLSIYYISIYYDKLNKVCPLKLFKMINFIFILPFNRKTVYLSQHWTTLFKGIHNYISDENRQEVVQKSKNNIII